MIIVETGSLASIQVEALVRAVNSDLDPVTPAARDLGLAAGSEILEQLHAMGEFPLGGAVITPGGEGASEFVIHIVILSQEEPITAAGVRRALLNGLRRAAHFGVQELALPMLGTGGGNLAAEVSAEAIAGALVEQRDAEGLPATVRVLVASDYELSVCEARLRLAGLLEE